MDVVPVPADTVGLAGILDHPGRDSSPLESEVHLLAFLVWDSLINFPVHKERRRLYPAGVGQRRLLYHPFARVRIPRSSKKLGFLCSINIGGAVVADPVANSRSRDGGCKPVGILRDEPIRHKAAIRMTGKAD